MHGMPKCGAFGGGCGSLSQPIGLSRSSSYVVTPRETGSFSATPSVTSIVIEKPGFTHEEMDSIHWFMA